MSLSRPLRRRLWLGPVVLIVTSILSLLFVELGLRWHSGRPITTLKLLPPVIQPTESTRDLTEFTSVIPNVINTDASWINLDPDLLPEQDQTDPELLAWRASAYKKKWKGFKPSLYRQWNAAFLDRHGCDENRLVLDWPAPMYEFYTESRSEFPIYRFLPNRTDPNGMRTNRFAWRGPDLPLDKPPNTIRLAFIGASTTVGSKYCRASYPEYVIHWLNLWAQIERPDLHFDGINAGREGLTAPHIAAIVRDEVLPMEPDLVFYYEGVNHVARWIKRDVRFEFVPPPPRDRTLLQASQYSVLALRLRRAIVASRSSGEEIARPKHKVPWPRGVSEENPEVMAPELPYGLTPIMRELENIRRLVVENDSEFAMASFVFLAEDGMVLEPRRDAQIQRFYETRLWPLTYAEVRKMADFENRVFKKFSRERLMGFVDLSRDYPQDPSLFLDGVHFDCDGIRLQAWIVFQRLLPLIKGRVATGVWPRPDEESLQSHPGIDPPRLTENRCEEAPQALED